MSSGYKLIYHKAAVKFIAKQEKATQERIAVGLKGLLEIPPKGDIQTMKGQSGIFRLRIGNIRILFEIDHNEQVIYIRSAGFRGDVYKS